MPPLQGSGRDLPDHQGLTPLAISWRPFGAPEAVPGALRAPVLLCCRGKSWGKSSGARNGTSIAPTLVFRGTGDAQQPMAAVGAAGNAWITSAVYQVVASMVDANLGPQEALEMPRFLVGVRRRPGAPDEVREIVIQIEDGFSPQVMRQLRSMGHEFQPISLRGELRMGYGAAVLVEDGRVRAGADPRRSGAAGAVH